MKIEKLFDYVFKKRYSKSSLYADSVYADSLYTSSKIPA